jgi:hypothetical protein
MYGFSPITIFPRTVVNLFFTITVVILYTNLILPDNITPGWMTNI